MAFRIEHRIGVAAPASEIWDLVYDLEGWKDWTGIYTNASGKIAIGETLEFTFKLGDRVPQSYKGVVYDWVPEHQMAWTTRFAGGMVTSLRYVEIIKLGDTSCILANGDYWTGPLAWTMSKALRHAARAGFQHMNEAAKQKVEAAFVPKGGQPAQVAPDPEGLTIASIQPIARTVTNTTPWGFGRRKPGTMGFSK